MRNPYDSYYPYSISDDCEELAFFVWETYRALAIAKIEGDKKAAGTARVWLNRHGWPARDTVFASTTAQLKSIQA